MKKSVTSRIIRFFVLSLAVLLTLAAAAWLYQRQLAQKRYSKITNSGDWCRLEEHCIQEAIYSYQIQNSEGHKPSSLFFLSVNGDRDPDTEVLKRLESSSYRVRAVSQSLKQGAVIKEKDSGEPGIILTVGKITWLDRSSVDVQVSAYSGWGDVKGYVYHLTHGENGWVISERKFALES